MTILACDLGGTRMKIGVVRDGHVLANEMAPRPHNSGHWSIDGCVTSQFEQLVRAVAGLPLDWARSYVDRVNAVDAGASLDHESVVLDNPNCLTLGMELECIQLNHEGPVCRTCLVRDDTDGALRTIDHNAVERDGRSDLLNEAL